MLDKKIYKQLKLDEKRQVFKIETRTKIDIFVPPWKRVAPGPRKFWPKWTKNDIFVPPWKRVAPGEKILAKMDKIQHILGTQNGQNTTINFLGEFHKKNNNNRPSLPRTLKTNLLRLHNFLWTTQSHLANDVIIFYF